jgi:hypothetical protein
MVAVFLLPRKVKHDVFLVWDLDVGRTLLAAAFVVQLWAVSFEP